MDSTPTLSLPSLPPEILADNIFALRATCKQIESKLFYRFGTQFFSQKRVWRNYVSLSTLDAMAESRLRSFLKTITIGLELLPPVHEARSGSHRKRRRAINDQDTLLSAGWATSLLSSSLLKLTNLVKLAVEDVDNCDPQFGWGFTSIAEISGFKRRLLENVLSHKEEPHGVACVQMLMNGIILAQQAGGLPCLKELQLNALNVPDWKIDPELRNVEPHRRPFALRGAPHTELHGKTFPAIFFQLAEILFQHQRQRPTQRLRVYDTSSSEFLVTGRESRVLVARHHPHSWPE